MGEGGMGRYWLASHVTEQCGFLAQVPKLLSGGLGPQRGPGLIQDFA